MQVTDIGTVVSEDGAGWVMTLDNPQRFSTRLSDPIGPEPSPSNQKRVLVLRYPKQVSGCCPHHDRWMVTQPFQFPQNPFFPRRLPLFVPREPPTRFKEERLHGWQGTDDEEPFPVRSFSPKVTEVYPTPFIIVPRPLLARVEANLHQPVQNTVNVFDRARVNRPFVRQAGRSQANFFAIQEEALALSPELAKPESLPVFIVNARS
jgi:hypothetical protein